MRIKEIFTFALLIANLLVGGQDRMDGPIVVCPAAKLPNEYKLLNDLRANARVSSGARDIFEVEYVGFSEEAKEGFQYAVDIWESILKSDVKIRVRATWEDLGDCVLTAAGATSFYRNFANAPLPNIWYPVS